MVVDIPEGATTTEIARLLEEEGIISDAFAFRVWLRTKGSPTFEAGEYDQMRRGSSFADVLDRLRAGPLPPDAVTVTIPEGLTLRQVIDRLSSEVETFRHEDLVDALGRIRPSRFMPAGSRNFEGFLFPDTYRIDETSADDEAAFLQRMVDRFDEVAGEVGLTDAGASGLSPYELVTVASIVEREAKRPEERPLVARVILNRLEAGMKLEVDATLLYAIGHKERLTESDLDTDSPYNTRLYPGLPPTPIGMPGRSALEAALRPAEGDWLYYVLTDPNGTHLFTDDYDEFLTAKAESRRKGLL